MNDFLEQLSAETLEPSEVRSVLERLALDEFGGEDHPTIGDVAEAASTSPEAVGRILAQIRGTTLEAWRSQFEQRLDSHDERLRKLESKSTSVIPTFIGTKPTYRQPEAGTEKETRVVAWVGIAIVVVSAIAWFNNQFASVQVLEWRNGGGRVGSGGYTFGFDEGCNWSEETAMGRPGPIVHQAEANDARRLASAMGLRCE